MHLKHEPQKHPMLMNMIVAYNQLFVSRIEKFDSGQDVS